MDEAADKQTEVVASGPGTAEGRQDTGELADTRGAARDTDNVEVADDAAWFEPREKQKQLVHVLQARDYGISMTQACKEVGIARQTWWKWTKDDRFAKWYADQGDLFWKFKLTEVDQATFAAATGRTPINGRKQGSTADRRLFLERHDDRFAPRSRQESTVQAKTEHSLSAESESLLRRRLGVRRAESAALPAPED